MAQGSSESTQAATNVYINQLLTREQHAAEMKSIHARLKFYKENKKRVNKQLGIGNVVSFEAVEENPECSYSTEVYLQGQLQKEMQVFLISNRICQLWNDREVEVDEEQPDIELSMPETGKTMERTER